MQKTEETLLDKADEVAGGWLQESKKVLPGIARACLMASTLEDSFRYWRDYKMYNTYFDKTDYKYFNILQI